MMKVMGIALMLVGLLQAVPACLWFRLPGKSFWACWWTPYQKVNQQLQPAGVALWIAGSAHSFVGLLLLVEWHARNTQ